MALVSTILYFILLLLPGHEFCFYNTVIVTVTQSIFLSDSHSEKLFVSVHKTLFIICKAWLETWNYLSSFWNTIWVIITKSIKFIKLSK